MADIGRGNHQVSDAKGHRSTGQDNVTVQCFVIRGRLAPPTGVGPEQRCLPHGRRGDRQILQDIDHGVEPRKPLGFVGTQQLTAYLVVGDLETTLDAELAKAVRLEALKS